MIRPVLPVTSPTTYRVEFDYSSPTPGAVAVPEVFMKSAKPIVGPGTGIRRAASTPATATVAAQRFSETFVLDAELVGTPAAQVITNLVIANAGNGSAQELVIGPVTITKL